MIAPEAWAPTRLAVSAVFVAGTGVVAVVVGMLVRAGELAWLQPGEVPLQEMFPVWGLVLFGAWMLLAVLISLVAPLAVVAVWGRDPVVRGALIPYVALLLVQVSFEVVGARLFFPNLVVVVGLIYTGYRLWQLGHSEKILASAADVSATVGRRAARLVLLCGLVFWSLNLAFLLAVILTLAVQS